MSTLKCGVIGCGVIGPLHIKCLQQIENVEVTWACDLDAAKTAKVAEEFGIPQQTTDYPEVLRDPAVSAVCVCTDHASHIPITEAALDAGKHVLCEKALGSSRDGLATMLAAHERHPELVFCGVFQHRFDAVYRQLKQLIDDGTLGTVLTAGVQVRCKRTNEYYQSGGWRGTWDGEGGAVLINQAIHFIDVLNWIMGGVTAVCGGYANLTHQDVIETEDTATAALRFKNGALGTIEATCSSNLGWETTISVHGSAGGIDVRDGKLLKVAFAAEAVQNQVEERFATCAEREQEALGKSYYGPSHGSQIADFVEAVREQRPPFVTAASARHTVELVLAVYESSRGGKWIELPAQPAAAQQRSSR